MLHKLFCHFLIKKKTINKKHISIINTYDVGGGAAKIASQISLSSNVEYIFRFFVKSNQSKEIGIIEIPKKKYSFLEELLRREALKKGWIEFTGFHGLNLLNDSFFNSSYIVHLNNLHGEFISPSIFKILFKGKKVIWTLHDESLITGHCSCTLGCNRWQIGCGSCPDLTIYPPVNFDKTKEILFHKKKWVTDLQPIIVCPSHWLAKRVRLAYPNLKRIEVIPNGVDTQIFFPRDKFKIRKLLGFPLHKKIVLFVAEFATNNPFKGGAILREIILDTSFSDVVFVTVGGKDDNVISNHISFPYIVDENELANLYAACDILLYPTQADNLPLVVLESMACGTPVIASRIGGIQEIITSELDGYLVDDYRFSFEFKRKLDEFLKLDEDDLKQLNSNSIKKIVDLFNIKSMYESYENLYNLI